MRLRPQRKIAEIEVAGSDVEREDHKFLIHGVEDAGDGFLRDLDGVQEDTDVEEAEEEMRPDLGTVFGGLGDGAYGDAGTRMFFEPVEAGDDTNSDAEEEEGDAGAPDMADSKERTGEQPGHRCSEEIPAVDADPLNSDDTCEEGPKSLQRSPAHSGESSDSSSSMSGSESDASELDDDEEEKEDGAQVGSAGQRRSGDGEEAGEEGSEEADDTSEGDAEEMIPDKGHGFLISTTSGIVHVVKERLPKQSGLRCFRTFCRDRFAAGGISKDSDAWIYLKSKKKSKHELRTACKKCIRSKAFKASEEAAFGTQRG